MGGAPLGGGAGAGAQSSAQRFTVYPKAKQSFTKFKRGSRDPICHLNRSLGLLEKA